MRALYKYPQAEFPYAPLVDENRRRGKDAPEYELLDTSAFDGERYFDTVAEYAKAAPDDVLIRITVANRGPETAEVHLLPTLWFRNTWSWGRAGEGYWAKPLMYRASDTTVQADHATLGSFRFAIEPDRPGGTPEILFTENETNHELLFGVANPSPYVKDSFHAYVVEGRREAVNPAQSGTKAAAYFRLSIPAGEARTLRLRLFAVETAPEEPFGEEFDKLFARRIAEADAFYASRVPPGASPEEASVIRQAYAGLLWSKQFYHYIVKDWIEGDPSQPPPPSIRGAGRNHDWIHLFSRDVLSMPDKWEYPWFAAWDLAFHMIPFANVDPEFAKEQLVLLLREWYMHPNGQIPAYEFAFTDVNPPVHAWAAWRVYKMTGPPGKRDRVFLSRVFQKLIINFTWWVNRKDVEGKNLFSGGFLGLDNIGVFDRSKPLPSGGHLEQADGTAWMAFYCATMLSIALELARDNPATEDLASKFFEHFIAIADAMNSLGGTGLWDEADGFYYDQLHLDGTQIPLRVRSMVGLIPLFTCEILEHDEMARLPGFYKRLRWFLDNRQDLFHQISYMKRRTGSARPHRLLAIPSRERLVRMLRYLLDENEFLSPYGIRSLSRLHKDHPYSCYLGGAEHCVEYVPGESNTSLFGGNSNWRGPVWFPVNYLLIEALERYAYFYADTLRVECPTGSGRMMNLAEVAHEISSRLARLFLVGENGQRPCHGGDRRFAADPHWRDLVLFYEYFHGDNGRGIGASHQTGWTSLAVRCIEDLVRARARR
jgi:hypothetical protein